MHNTRQEADAAVQANAASYSATMFLGRAQYDAVHGLPTLQAACTAAAALAAKHSNGRPAMVYAVDAHGNSTHVTNVAATLAPKGAAKHRRKRQSR